MDVVFASGLALVHSNNLELRQSMELTFHQTKLANTMSLGQSTKVSSGKRSSKNGQTFNRLIQKKNFILTSGTVFRLSSKLLFMNEVDVDGVALSN